MKAIVAVDKNWGIGKKNDLLFSLPADMAYFREKTLNKVCCMGYNTLLSFPGSKPLKNRTNIVITKDVNYKVEGAIVVHSVEEAIEAAKDFADEDIFVIGGESIYRQMLQYCDVAHITKIDYAYQADAYFPNLDKEEGWVITETSDERTYFDLIYEFVKYEKK